MAMNAETFSEAGDLRGVADLRAFLLGTWRLSRSIDDRRTGQRGTFEGVAVFRPEGAELSYREAGRLALGGFETLASRGYRYAFPAPGRAEVRFADGAPFHALELSAAAWDVAHPCGADLYRGTFRLAGAGRWTASQWTAVWRITGPRKDQRLDGLYARET